MAVQHERYASGTDPARLMPRPAPNSRGCTQCYQEPPIGTGQSASIGPFGIDDRLRATATRVRIAAPHPTLTRLTTRGAMPQRWRSTTETEVCTPNFVPVAIDGANLAITIDTKGVMSPEMRDGAISIISEAASTAGAQSIEISDMD